MDTETPAVIRPNFKQYVAIVDAIKARLVETPDGEQYAPGVTDQTIVDDLVAAGHDRFTKAIIAGKRKMLGIAVRPPRGHKAPNEISQTNLELAAKLAEARRLLTQTVKDLYTAADVLVEAGDRLEKKLEEI